MSVLSSHSAVARAVAKGIACRPSPPRTGRPRRLRCKTAPWPWPPGPTGPGTSGGSPNRAMRIEVMQRPARCLRASWFMVTVVRLPSYVDAQACEPRRCLCLHGTVYRTECQSRLTYRFLMKRRPATEPPAIFVKKISKTKDAGQRETPGCRRETIRKDWFRRADEACQQIWTTSSGPRNPTVHAGRSGPRPRATRYGRSGPCRGFFDTLSDQPPQEPGHDRLNTQRGGDHRKGGGRAMTLGFRSPHPACPQTTTRTDGRAIPASSKTPPT
jgi:hypothetical protein